MKSPTIIKDCKDKNMKTAFLTVKGKVLGVYGEGVNISISAQTPNKDQLEYFGGYMPAKISDVSSTEWIMKVALAYIEKENPDFVYCTTNYCIFHHCGPNTKEAREQIYWIDHYINEIHKADPNRQIYITAEHGMGQKHDF